MPSRRSPKAEAAALTKQRAHLSGLFATAFVSALLLLSLFSAAFSQDNTARKPSTCLAVADNTRHLPVQKVSTSQPLVPVQKSRYSVNIRYATHSTYRIESPEGVVMATDFAGTAGSGRLPDIVTMNNAHITHWTLTPDPAIPHVLPGWARDGSPAEHYLEVKDTLVRNVPTDHYRSGMLVKENGNSIFVFEVAGLCIGHLGHLHHKLTPQHIAAIGRLDVLMIPVDGSYTLSIDGMAELAGQFRSSVILPMHWFSGYSLSRFIERMRSTFAIDVRDTSEVDVALNTLPSSPTVIVLQPELDGGFGMGFGGSDP